MQTLIIVGCVLAGLVAGAYVMAVIKTKNHKISTLKRDLADSEEEVAALRKRLVGR